MKTSGASGLAKPRGPGALAADDPAHLRGRMPALPDVGFWQILLQKSAAADGLSAI
jgi:hypothetical protein